MRKALVLIASVALAFGVMASRPAAAGTVCDSASVVGMVEDQIEGVTGNAEDPALEVVDTVDTAAGLGNALC